MYVCSCVATFTAWIFNALAFFNSPLVSLMVKVYFTSISFHLILRHYVSGKMLPFIAANAHTHRYSSGWRSVIKAYATKLRHCFTKRRLNLNFFPILFFVLIERKYLLCNFCCLILNLCGWSRNAQIQAHSSQSNATITIVDAPLDSL